MNAAVVVSLVPELELLLGKPPPVPELPPQDAQSRFQLVFRRFIAVFARERRPLALFLDDLQWLDTATIDVIEDLVARAGLRNLLLVGAYRDNEVGAAHPLRRRLDGIRAAARVHDLPLAPLAHDALAALVGDAVHAEPLAAGALATLVHDRTAGNPFFAIQFLTSLAEDGLLAFSPRGGWQWDPERIRATARAESVVDLVAGKLARLPDGARHVLAVLGCLGSAARSAVLAIACGIFEEALHAALREAVRAGLVFRLHDGYAFAHDRVQEGAYALIPEARRPAEHLRVGRRLAAGLSDDELGARLFEVSNQLNRGVALIGDEAERRALAALNQRAGMKARGAVAWAAASRHLAQAAALLPADAWARSYRETFDLTLALSECEYLAGNFQRADELFDLLLAQAQSDLDRASVYALRMRLYQVAGKYDEGVSIALRAMRLFGVDLPENEADIGPATAAELAEISERMRGRAYAELLDAPVATSPEVRAVINLLVEAAPCAYIARPPLFPLFVLRGVTISLRHGNTDQSAFAYGVYALLLAGGLGDIPRAFEVSELSLRLNERFGNARLRGTLLHLHGDHVRPWVRPFADVFPILEQAFTACPEVGDLVYASYVAFEILWQHIECGERLDDVLAGSARYAAFARESHNDAVLETIRLQQQFIACLQGKTRDPLSLDDAAGSFDEATALAAIARATFFPGVFFYHAIKQIVAFLHGRHEEALQHAASAEPYLGAAMAMPIEATYHLVHALTVAALLPAAAPAERAAYRELLDAKLAKLEVWARHCPENFGHRHVLLAAEVARVDGRTADAARLYEDAARAAREHGAVQHEALAHELAARFHAALGATTAVRAHAAAARSAFQRWGASAMVRHVEEAFPGLGAEDAARPSATAAPAPASPGELDLATVIKVSQALSAELVVDALIERLMVIAVENAGAARGVLILARDGELRVEAQASAVEDGVRVRLGSSAIAPAELPESLLRFVARTGETVILGDAVAGSRFAPDPYVAATRARSILCLPLVKQGRLVGLVYLENNLAPEVFTPRRTALLELLASQAAISLENARLHADVHSARDQLRRAEREHRLTIDAIPSLAWSTRPDGSIELLNEQWLAYTGLTLAEADDNWGWRGAIHPQDLEPLVKAWTTSLATGNPLDIEARMRRHDGVYRWFLLRGRPLRDEQGSITRWYGTNTDIDDLKRAEAALRRNEDFLNDGERMSHTGSFSWDLTTGELQWSLETCRIYEVDPAVSPKLEMVVERTHPADVQRTRELYERVVREPADWEIERRLLFPDGRVKVVHVLARLVRDEAGNAHYAGAVKDVTLARRELRQVLVNLVGNAVKFTAEGEIEVEVELAPGMAGHASEVWLRFAVRDTGIGVPRDKQAAIFRAFEQADTSTTRKYGGTGLGLTIAAQLIGLMGGQLTVDSEPERGSTFAFAARFERQAHPAAAGAAPELLRGVRVLVVDDNATNRRLFDGWLRGWGMEPTAVGDRAAALDALRQGVARGRPHALLLLDARLPDTDGTTLAARIRERPELAGTPIILLTSGDRAGDSVRFRELRVEEQLLKPVLQEELLESMLRVLSLPRAGRPAAVSSLPPIADATPSAPRSPDGLRVLIAEDNELNQRVIHELLTRRGHEAQLAGDGEQAIRLLETGSFDLLLLDLHMPLRDGFQVIAALRERERSTSERLPVIALTARSRREDRDRVLAAGMDDFITKPLHAEDLWAAIARVGAAPRRAARQLLDSRALLAACGEDAAILERLCATFRRRLPSDMDAIAQALRDGDASRLREAAHKLTAMVGTFSTIAGQLASDLEDCAARGELDAATALVRDLEGMTAELLALAGGLSIARLRATLG